MPKRISEVLNLEKAYAEVLEAERYGQDFIPDILNFLDSKKSKAQMLQELKQEIDDNSFQTEGLIKIDVPKDSFFIRPGGRPYLKDWILYQALVDYIGLKADRKLGRNVKSSRFNLKKGKLFHWDDQWLEFERAFWANFDKGFKWVLKTDITAYFTNISVERLRSIIKSLLDETEEVRQVEELLFNGFLRPWTESEINKYFGLPQGPSASSVLANLFLHNVDALISRNKNIRYLRYADDIRILAKNKVDIKIELQALIIELRNIGLDLNAKKTQILSPSQAERELRDPRRQDMDRIKTILNMRDETLIKKEAIPLIEDIFENSFDPANTFGDRHLRFSINRFVQLRKIYKEHREKINTIGLKLIGKLEAMPGSANTFSRFFSAFPEDSFKKELLKFLKSKNNIYEWQEMWILDSLLRFKSFNQSELDVFRKTAFDRDKKAPTRSKAILLLGKFGDEPQRYELREKFTEEVDYLMKRAIIVATQGLSTAEKSGFYSTAKRTDPEQADLIDYVKSLSKPIYFDRYSPSPISVIEEQY